MPSNTRQSQAAIALATLLATYPASSIALEPVSSARLADKCRAFLERPGSDRGRSCASYVRGFIDGSPIVVVVSAARSTDAAESFSQRAARTRLGRPVAARPSYCIERSVATQTLVEQIVTVADEAGSRDDQDASVLLYATFARFYRCREP